MRVLGALGFGWRSERRKAHGPPPAAGASAHPGDTPGSDPELGDCYLTSRLLGCFKTPGHKHSRILPPLGPSVYTYGLILAI